MADEHRRLPGLVPPIALATSLQTLLLVRPTCLRSAELREGRLFLCPPVTCHATSSGARTGATSSRSPNFMKRSAPLLLVAALGLAACSDTDPVSVQNGATAPAPSLSLGSSAEPEFVAGQIIVRFRPGAARSEIAEAHRSRKKEDMLLERTEILTVPVGEELEIAAQLAKNPNVEFAEPDWISKLGPCEVSDACNQPDGQFFDYKWDLHNTGVVRGQLGAKADADIDWVEAFDFLGGSSFTGSAVIGILDTGIRPTHQAFTNKILGGRRFLSDGVAVTNYIDDHSHGTHVAGIAAGRGGAALPGVGYGANIKLLVGKVCNSAGSCPASATANGIVWMADNGANVINMSLGSFGGAANGTGSAAQQTALRYAASKNVLSVCATGNDDNKPTNGYTGGVGYPARFPECMAVGATSWNDTKASYSNYGPEIEISAPGGDGNPQGTSNSLIIAAVHTGDGSYNYKAGTSMATPQVAGLAALLYATGTTDAVAIRQRLKESADDVEAPGWDARTGAGRINAYRAITGKDPNAPPVAKPVNADTGNKGVAMAFDGTTSLDPNGKTIKAYSWNFGDAKSASNTATTAQASHTFMRAGTYTVSLTVTDASNLTDTKTSTVVIPNIVPLIGTFAGATIMQGETYTTSGSFSDADPDDWTATVNYGDGSGTQTLALAGKTFGLAHSYTTAGSHTVTVAVNDDDHGSGTRTATVTVWSPQQGIAQTLTNTLGSGSTSALAPGAITALRATLAAATESLDRGNTTAANGQLQAFTLQVDGFVRGRQLTASAGAELTASVNRILASINR
jgi:PKD repeat protein